MTDAAESHGSRPWRRLVCSCEHGQRSHESYLGDTMCLGYHQTGHPYADEDDALTARERRCRCEAFTLASPDKTEPFAVPTGWILSGLGSCRSCGQAIAWCRTPKGKNAPIDRDGVSHFATCPSADAWRHRR